MFNPNHRKFSRSQVSVAALLSFENMAPIEVQLIDVSMNGALLHTDIKPAPGTCCSVSILIGHFQHELPIEAAAVVVRNIENGIALKFESVKIDSTPKLQDLIIEHAENPKQSELEFSQNGGWIFSPDQPTT